MLKEHAGILRSICFLYSNNKTEFDDLYQDMLYQLWKSLPGFKGNSKLSTWIYKVALFTALAHIRKKPRHKLVRIDHLENVQNDDESTDQWEKIELALKKLNKTERALMLLYLENKPYKEIAEIMGITESNVGVKLNRTKAKLKSLMSNND